MPQFVPTGRPNNSATAVKTRLAVHLTAVRASKFSLRSQV